MAASFSGRCVLLQALRRSSRIDSKLNVHLRPAELEQFAYDVTVEVEDSQIVVTTDEIDVSAFLTVLIEKGARVEVYSAYAYPENGHGRGG